MFTVVPYVSRMVGKIMANGQGYRRPPDLESQGAFLIIPNENLSPATSADMSTSDDSDNSSLTRRHTFSGSDCLDDKAVVEHVSGDLGGVTDHLQSTAQPTAVLELPTLLEAQESGGAEGAAEDTASSPTTQAFHAESSCVASYPAGAAAPVLFVAQGARASANGTGPWGTPLAQAPRYPTTLVPKRTSTSAPLPRPPGCLVEVVYSELQFLQQVGEGGFGKVYYGLWRGQPVAIKTAALQGSESSEIVQEFHREVSTMCSLPAHQNVLRLLAACTVWPDLALVTEYCSCGSLYHLLHSPNRGQLSWTEILQICLGVAKGMAHLHEHRVLHRDLKSANLLLSDSGEVKIADFGLSKIHQDLQGAHTGGLGTYQWMAPEVLAHQRYSEKADIYSFGIVVWECITRRLPYTGMTAVQAAVGVVNHGLRPEIPGNVPAPLAKLIRSCWAAVPDQRPAFSQIVMMVSGMLRNVESLIC